MTKKSRKRKRPDPERVREANDRLNKLFGRAHKKATDRKIEPPEDIEPRREEL